MFRTDSHNNPTAFTTDIAIEARLKQGVDYTIGDPFSSGGGGGGGVTGHTYHTARLIGDPIAITIRVIDALSFFTQHGTPVSRWGYISMPYFVWIILTAPEKRDVIGYMYQREGGTAMKQMFPNYGKP